MARTLLTVRSVHDQLYDYALSSAFRSAWVYDPSFALHREPDIWELVRNDAVIAGAIERSTKAIVRPWRMVSFGGSRDIVDRQIAQVVEDALRNIDRFNSRRRRLAEARVLGRTYAAILWRKRRISLGGLPEMDWFIPVSLIDIDRRRFHWSVEWDGSMRVKKGIRLEMYDTNECRWVPVPPELRNSLIEFIYNDTEDRIGYGRGLLEAIYFYHYMKTVTFEKVSQGIDRWANGIWIGKIDGLRAASVEKTTEDLRLGMEQVLRDMRSSNQAVVENVDDIKVIETSGTGHEITMDFMRYLDESIERLLNGSVRPAGYNVGGTGARAQASVEAETSEEFFQDDREENDSIIQRDLVGAFLRYNTVPLERAGLSRARIPVFTTEQIKRQDPEAALRVISQAVNFVPVAVKEIYEKAELSRPLPDEEVVGPLRVEGMTPGPTMSWHPEPYTPGMEEELPTLVVDESGEVTAYEEPPATVKFDYGQPGGEHPKEAVSTPQSPASPKAEPPVGPPAPSSPEVKKVLEAIQSSTGVERERYLHQYEAMGGRVIRGQAAPSGVGSRPKSRGERLDHFIKTAGIGRRPHGFRPRR